MMATKLTPRASVRLRIDRGTALITNLGGDPISCDLAEISLSGCKCRIPLAGTAEDILSAWKLILVPGRMLSLRFSEPPEFRALHIPAAEVRWVNESDGQAIFFGVSFGGLSAEQSLVLSTNLMHLASSKLRVKREPAPAAETEPVSAVESAAATPEPASAAVTPAPEPLAQAAVPVPAVETVPEATEATAVEEPVPVETAAASVSVQPALARSIGMPAIGLPAVQDPPQPEPLQAVSNAASASTGMQAVQDVEAAPKPRPSGSGIQPVSKSKSSATRLPTVQAAPKSAVALPRVQSKPAIATPVARIKSSASMPAVPSQFSTGRKRLPGRPAPQFLNTRGKPSAPELPQEPPRKTTDWSDFDRQVLITGGFPLMFYFIDADGRKFDEIEHAARVSQFSETEFQIEADAPNFCQAPDIVGKVQMLAKVKAPETEFLVQLTVRSVKSTEGSGRWLYGTKVAALGDGDRGQLQELYTRMSRPVSTRSKAIREMSVAELELANLREHAAKTTIALNEMRRNLEAARQAQSKMLPDRPPAVAGYDMAALYESCVELSGDLYHFIDAGPGCTGLLIGDVSGHGVEAAMVMSATLKSFSVRGKGVASPAAVLSAVNEDLHNDLRRGMFVTAFYAILEHETGKLTYGRAGHNPALLISPRIGLRPLEGNGLALGIAPSKKFNAVIQEHTAEIQNDALLVMYTDGIVEAMNAQKEEFGEGRLCELLWQNSGQPCETIIQQIQAAVHVHTAGFPIADDQTLVLLKKS